MRFSVAVYLSVVAALSCCATPEDFRPAALESRISRLEAHVLELETKVALIEATPRDRDVTEPHALDNSTETRTFTVGGDRPSHPGIYDCPPWVGGRKCYFDGCNWCNDHSCTLASCAHTLTVTQ